MKRKNNLILEFTEFNLQKMSLDSAAQAVGGVDDPSLSTNAFLGPLIYSEILFIDILLMQSFQ